MTRKWRPAHKSIYVISDICGNAQSLEVILDRILPLRFHKRQEDTLVFLGNYIGTERGCEVIDQLINIKQQYNDRVVMLRGKNEELMLRAIFGDASDFDNWMENAGRTTITGYVKKAGLSSNPYSIAQNRLKDIIPKSHIEFLQSLDHFFILNEEYCFFNSGFDHKKTIRENNLNNFCFDTTSNRYVKNAVKNKTPIEFLDNYVFVCSANPQSEEPYIHPRYMMLGGTAPERILTLELNSMNMSACTRGKSRIYKYDYNVVE